MKEWIRKFFSKVKDEPVAECLERKHAKVDVSGDAGIPKGTKIIGNALFEKNKELRRAVLPDTVKEVKYASFRACPNLEKLVFNEGLEIIGSNVFSGCPKLKELVLPDSVRKVDAYTFYDTCFQQPLFNKSGTGLFHYPNSLTEKVYAVPSRVKRLFSGVFFDNTQLEEVILPEGLEKIDTRAFLKTKIRKITIPSTVKLVEADAFWCCDHLEEVHYSCPESAFERKSVPGKQVHFLNGGAELGYDESLRIRGCSRLGMVWRIQVPEGDFWKTEEFLKLAERCSKRDAGAMMELAAHFEGLGDEDFFRCAANFWRYRAYQLGEPDAVQWKEKMDSLYYRQPIPSVLTERLTHGASGKVLRALGFLFFEPDRDYSMDGMDQNGVVQVDSWCDDEGPDEDGFGREEYYDWWLLDDTLNPIPGIRWYHSYSRREMRFEEKNWKDLREKAGQIIRNRMQQ